MTDIELANTGSGTFGLDDLDDSDQVTPYLTIDKDELMFKDGLSGELFPSLEVVILGLVKARILWPAEPGAEPGPPLCKSLDYHLGYPNMNESGASFPWKDSGFKLGDYLEEQPPILKCEDCHYQEWGSHPKNDKTPWCSTLFQMPVLIKQSGGGWSPSIFVAQRTGLADAKKYLKSFDNARTPCFVNTTTLGLDIKKRGTNSWATATYKKGSPTDKEMYPAWIKQYIQIRTFLTTPRGEVMEDEDMVSTPVRVAPPTSTVGAPIETTAHVVPAAAAAAPTTKVGVDELPF